MEIIYTVVNTIISGFCTLITWGLELLPLSPLAYVGEFIDTQILSYINWFVPVKTILNILGVWCSAMAVYYMVSVALRWAKAIE